VAIHTIIGLKRLDRAKQRLAPHLAPGVRRRLMLRMLEAVVAAALDAAMGPVALATSEPTAAVLARGFGVTNLSDGGLAWNDGLVHALSSVSPLPDSVLFLAGDVPLVTAVELGDFVAAAPSRGVCIARARDAGTNALLLTPPNVLRPAFGTRRSSEVHAALAARSGVPFQVVDICGLAIDIDTIDDARDAGILGGSLIETGRAPGAG